MGKAKDFLQNLIREKSMPPKPTLDIDMAEFRTMRNLMIRVQDEARGIRNLQDNILPKLKTQLDQTTGIFKGKERKALTEQIQQTEKEISERMDKLPDILKEDGYPDVQAFMATYPRRRLSWSGTTVTSPNGNSRQRKAADQPKKNDMHRLRKKVSVIRSGSCMSRANKQPRRKKSFDRDSR